MNNMNSSQKFLTQPINVCVEDLCNKEIILRSDNNCDCEYSENAIILGLEIADLICDFIESADIAEDENLYYGNEVESDVFEDIVSESSQLSLQESEESEGTLGQSNSEYSPEAKRAKFHYVPIDTKIKIINMVNEHPKWKLRSIRANGGAALCRMDQLARWRKEVVLGGGSEEKFESISQWVYKRFIEARQGNIPVTTRNLQEWALQASKQYKSDHFQFVASLSWAIRFKRKFNIKQRKVTRYIKPIERSLEDIKQASEEFAARCSTIISEYNKDFVINTDQIGCEYRINLLRTLEHKGKKSMEVDIGDLNKVTHSYTAQYSITASGKLLPIVFICLQEAQGTFGPTIKRKILELTEYYENIYVVYSKSGKLSAQLFEEYTSNVLKPYVTENRFLLIVDSWGGQKNVDQRKIFENSNEEQNCQIQTIPPGCTGYNQPLDVYFHRQVKFFIKEMQNCTYFIEQKRQINKREDAIKIHSLVHNQLSAPMFRDMVIYA